MMAIDKSQIEDAIARAPTEAQASAIDKVLSERRRVARMRAAAAIRIGDDAPWMILRVSTNEIRVRDDMLAADIEALVPMKKAKQIRRRGILMPVRMQSVLPGYMLVRCPLTNDAMAGVMSFEGAYELLGGYGNPFLISAEKVRDFNKKAEEGLFDDERPVSLYSHLKKVEIVEGPFAGFHADVVTPVGAGSGTAVVEIVIFGAPRPMILPLASLRPL
jgi:transcription termination/antitermination protein NusG